MNASFLADGLHLLFLRLVTVNTLNLATQPAQQQSILRKREAKDIN